MKSQFLALALFAAMCASPAAAWQSTPVDTTDAKQKAPAPKLVLEKPELDLGTVHEHTNTDGVIKFTNKGDAELKITTLKSTCGCTVPELGQKTYAPGESGEINVIFKPRGKSGKVEQTVTITSNDPASKQTKVKVFAFVKPLVEISPKAVGLGRIERGQGSTFILTVSSTEPGFAATRATVGGNPGIKAKVIETIETEIDGETFHQSKIEITVPKDAKPGPIRGSLVIRTTHPQRFLVNATIAGEVLGFVRRDVDKLNVGAVQMDGTFEKKIKFSHQHGKPFKIVKIEDIGRQRKPSFTWELKPFEAEEKYPAGGFELVLKLRDDVTPGPIMGQLVLSTDVEGEEKIKVSYSGRVVQKVDLNQPDVPTVRQPGESGR